MIVMNWIIFAAFSGFFSVSHGKLPKSVSVCSRNDPKLSECIIESIKKVQPFLATGDLGDDFHVAPLEPFAYEGFTINPAPNFNVKISNVSLLGSSNFSIEKLKFNISNLTNDMIFLFPKITLLGKYDMKAKVSILDIVGKGDLESISYNTRMRVKVQAKKHEKNGETYIKYDKVVVRIQPNKSTIKLTNLFNGDPLLQNVGNQVINENQGIFLEYIIPIMEKQFARILKDVSHDIIENATYDELFPDTPVGSD